MKRILFYAMIVILASSCGASRKAAESQVEAPAKVWKSEAQIYAEDPDRTNLRAWAKYTGFPQERLESIAATRARAELANSISVLIINAYKEFGENIGESNLSAEADATVKSHLERIEKLEDEIQAVANGFIKGSRIVMSDRYREKNGTETAYVCVEMPLETIEEQIQESKNFKKIFNDEDIKRIDDREKKFKKSMKDAFEELKRSIR